MAEGDKRQPMADGVAGRRHPRYRSDLPVTIRRRGRIEAANLRTCSRKGIDLIAPRTGAQRGHQLEVVVLIEPQPMTGLASGELRITGRVVWRKEERDGARLGVAIDSIEPLDLYLDLLLGLAQEAAVLSNQKPDPPGVDPVELGRSAPDLPSMHIGVPETKQDRDPLTARQRLGALDTRASVDPPVPNSEQAPPPPEDEEDEAPTDEVPAVEDPDDEDAATTHPGIMPVDDRESFPRSAEAPLQDERDHDGVGDERPQVDESAPTDSGLAPLEAPADSGPAFFSGRPPSPAEQPTGPRPRPATPPNRPSPTASTPVPSSGTRSTRPDRLQEDSAEHVGKKPPIVLAAVALLALLLLGALLSSRDEDVPAPVEPPASSEAPPRVVAVAPSPSPAPEPPIKAPPTATVAPSPVAAPVVRPTPRPPAEPVTKPAVRPAPKPIPKPATKPIPKPAKKVVATGKVIFGSDPMGAKVTIKGQKTITTPMSMSLPVGTHQVRFEKKGYRAITRFIRVAADGSSQVSVQLDPMD